MIKKEMVVVGGGPAGLAAAIEAAKRGVEVLVIDANLKAGGQLFKQIHKFFGSSAHRAGVRGIDIGADMLKEAEALGSQLSPGAKRRKARKMTVDTGVFRGIQ